jgi:hypothetical protein
MTKILDSFLVATALTMSTPAMGQELLGYKGDHLRGSISCIHQNIIRDLIGRISEEANYSYVARIYLQQGYCVEADVPTILVRPMADQTFKTWDGHQAEIWETVLEFDHAGGTRERLESYSIVFPREMEQYYTD